MYRLKRESALLGLILCFAISNTTIKGQKLAFKQGVTEELKATDMMRWIGLMNNIRACADEIVLNDIVYGEVLQCFLQFSDCRIDGKAPSDLPCSGSYDRVV